MKIVKYSKSYKNVIKLQKIYLIDNLNNLKNELRIKINTLDRKKERIVKTVKRNYSNQLLKVLE